MKTMSLDEMLLYYYFEKKPEPSLRLYWETTGLMLLGVLGLLIANSKFSQLCCFIAFCSGGIAYFLNIGRIIYSGWREDRFYLSVIERAKRLPLQKEILAKKLYGWPEGTLSAIECEEAHLPGDCPLCGAK
jgi:hypothetical protein